MSSEVEVCACDYSYTCPMHQRIFDEEIEKDKLQRHAEKQAQQLEWITASIKAIAAKLNIELPEEP